jgi:hypothetical protein
MFSARDCRVNGCIGRSEAEADQPPASDFPTPDMLTGKKMADNDVLQFARNLLDEKP